MCSVGISLCVSGSTGGELFEQADHAMGLAKWRQRGVRAGNRYVIFEDRSPGRERDQAAVWVRSSCSERSALLRGIRSPATVQQTSAT